MRHPVARTQEVDRVRAWEIEPRQLVSTGSFSWTLLLDNGALTTVDSELRCSTQKLSIKNIR